MSTSKKIREKIWTKLHDVARPDTRFHLNFAEVIPDFEGSEDAIDRVVVDSAYEESSFAFITPDNCLVDLRRRMIEDGKPMVMSTYGIYRGFLYLDPTTVPKGAALYASWLDGMEHFGVPITLEEIAQISEGHGFSVVEDAAHSMGASLCPLTKKHCSLARKGHSSNSTRSTAKAFLNASPSSRRRRCTIKDRPNIVPRVMAA